MAIFKTKQPVVALGGRSSGQRIEQALAGSFLQAGAGSLTPSVLCSGSKSKDVGGKTLTCLFELGTVIRERGLGLGRWLVG